MSEKLEHAVRLANALEEFRIAYNGVGHKLSDPEDMQTASIAILRVAARGCFKLGVSLDLLLKNVAVEYATHARTQANDNRGH